AYANQTSQTDPRNCTTTTVFETSQTYPESVTTCLGFATTFTHDVRWGERTLLTDPNGHTTTYTLDVFGRLTRITGPLDTGSTYGTITTTYADLGNPSAQRVVTYRTRDHGTANVVWSEQYFDGLGRIYLSRSQ